MIDDLRTRNWLLVIDEDGIIPEHQENRLILDYHKVRLVTEESLVIPFTAMSMLSIEPITVYWTKTGAKVLLHTRDLLRYKLVNFAIRNS